MDLNNFKLLKEDHENYHIEHPGGKSLIIAKKGLHKNAHERIKMLERKEMKRNFPDGGTVGEDAAGSTSDASSYQVPDYLKPNDQMQASPASVSAPAGAVDMDPTAAATKQAIDGQTPQGMFEQKDKNVEQSLKEQREAVQEIGQAKAQESKEEAAALGQAQKQMAEMPTQQQIFDQYQAKNDALMNAYRAQVIDPNRYYKNMSVPTKIAAGIGAIISGFGSGLTGQPNAALSLIKDSVDRDVMAQKNDQERAHNLYQMNYENMGSHLAADLATKNQLYTGVKYKLEQAAMKAGTPLALAQAKQQSALIDQQIAQNNYQLSLIHQGLGIGQGGQVQPAGGFVGDDPSILVNQLIKDPGQKEKAFEEINRAKTTSQNAPQIMEAFDKAATDVRPLSGGKIKNALPYVESAYNKQLEALMGPTLPKLEGTARQAAFDNLKHNVLPQFGDSDETIATKRDALKKYLLSATSEASVNKGSGIDLTKFRATTPNIPSENPKVRVFMQQNPGMTERQAEAILKKYGKM